MRLIGRLLGVCTGIQTTKMDALAEPGRFDYIKAMGSRREPLLPGPAVGPL
jgi:hypothetical protein